MRQYSDPTASQAIGAVNREWNRMVALAVRVRETHDTDWAARESLRFTGIYQRLLLMPLDELKAQLPKPRGKRGEGTRFLPGEESCKEASRR